MYEMKRHFIIVVFALIAALFCISSSQAQQKDVVLVFLQDDKGQRTLHQQPAPHESCVAMLLELRKATRTGRALTLTLEAPRRATEKVLDVYCMQPDGSIQTNCDGTITRHSLPGYTAITNKGVNAFCQFATDSPQGKKILTTCPIGSRCLVDVLLNQENRISTVLYVSRSD
jgi:hypothetical protein